MMGLPPLIGVINRLNQSKSGDGLMNRNVFALFGAVALLLTATAALTFSRVTLSAGNVGCFQSGPFAYTTFLRQCVFFAQRRRIKSVDLCLSPVPAEYNFTGFGTRSDAFITCGIVTCAVLSARANLQDAVVGVNYKF